MRRALPLLLASICFVILCAAFKEMQYRNALRAVLFDLSNHRDDYRARVQTLHK